MFHGVSPLLQLDLTGVPFQRPSGGAFGHERTLAWREVQHNEPGFRSVEHPFYRLWAAGAPDILCPWRRGDGGQPKPHLSGHPTSCFIVDAIWKCPVPTSVHLVKMGRSVGDEGDFTHFKKVFVQTAVVRFQDVVIRAGCGERAPYPPIPGGSEPP